MRLTYPCSRCAKEGAGPSCFLAAPGSEVEPKYGTMTLIASWSGLFPKGAPCIARD